MIKRCESNPIISYEAFPFRCIDISSAGAVKLGDEYILLISVQNLEGFYSIHAARSNDGESFVVNEQPLLYPVQQGNLAIYERNGVLDARITQLDDAYYITYDALGDHGHCLALAKTERFEKILRLGIISQPDDRAGALFPKKINGAYVRLECPWSGSSIWVNYSQDLEYWGGSEIIMSPREGFWDASRISGATPPIEIDEGWLFFYSGVKDTSAGPVFRIGAAILDKDDPSKLVARTNVPILTPRMQYERVGDIPNFIFSCGAILEDDGEIKLYYGAADSCICLGTAHVSEIVAACRESVTEP